MYSVLLPGSFVNNHYSVDIKNSFCHMTNLFVYLSNVKKLVPQTYSCHHLSLHYSYHYRFILYIFRLIFWSTCFKQLLFLMDLILTLFKLLEINQRKAWECKEWDLSKIPNLSEMVQEKPKNLFLKKIHLLKIVKIYTNSIPGSKTSKLIELVCKNSWILLLVGNELY